MLCEQCSVEIPPAWKKIIISNICPNCEGQIMSDKTKEFLDELKSAFERMPNDPEGLAGWLLSNYKLHKIGSCEPTNFYNGKQQQNNNRQNQGNDIDASQLKIAPNRVQQFIHNAGMDGHVQQGKDLRSMVEFINRKAAGEIPDTMYPNGNEPAIIEQDPNEELYPEEQEYIPTQSLAKQAFMNNSVFIPNKSGLPPLSSAEQAQMMNDVTKLTVDQNTEIPLILQQERMAKLAKQKSALEGGGKGAFRRGS